MTILTKPPIIGALLALFIVGWVIGGPANAIEAEIMRSMADIRSASPSLTAMAGGVTALGSAYVTLGVASLASLWLLLHRAPARALMLALIVLTERLLVDGLRGDHTSVGRWFSWHRIFLEYTSLRSRNMYSF